MTPRVRVRVCCGPRVEVHELHGPELVIGRGPDADLHVDHPTLAPRHARLAVRRGRLLLIDLGHAEKGIRHRDRRVLAPVALDSPDDRFAIGDVEISASLAFDSLPDDWSPSGFVVERELDAADAEIRRYRVVKDADAAELTVTRHSVSDADLDAWHSASELAHDKDGHHIPPILAYGRLEERGFLIEKVQEGLRLSKVVESIHQKEVALPTESLIAIIAQVADACAAMHATWGPHGAVEPRLIHLGRDGAVQLLRPGPNPRGYEDVIRRPYLAPERRYGVAPTRAADAWSVAQLASVLGAHDIDDSDIWAPLSECALSESDHRTSDLEPVGRSLREAAHGAGLDPSTAHVARLVRLLSPTAANPLATVR